MASRSSNKTAVPEAKGAMNKFKYEVASELGVPLTDGYNGDLTSKQNIIVMSLKDQFRLLGGAVMAKCAICEKGAHFGNNVSHSHRRSPKMWKSNVKSVRVKTEGGSQKMYVCTSCLRSGLVERA